MLIGGAEIKSYKATGAWGVNPASGSAEIILPTQESRVGVEVGDAISFSFYGLHTFHGIVTRYKTNTDFGSGRVFTMEIVDNRLRLQWMYVYAAWNMEDETDCKKALQANAAANAGESDDDQEDDEDEPLDFTSDRKPSGPEQIVYPTGMVVNPERARRYWSILPENWQTQTKTYHDQPFTVRQILNMAFAGAVGPRFGFKRSYGSLSNDCRPIGIDFLQGQSLASLITTLNEKTGMDIYLRGKNQLVWGIKGEGLLPLYPTDRDPEYSIGYSLAQEPTRIRVLGSPSVVQVMNIPLYPTWNRKWEAFIGEAEWLRHVAIVWSLDAKIHWAEIAAKAREVTLFDYCTKIADFSFADYGRFGEVIRMQMTCWTYIEELVYKHYSVLPDFLLFGSISPDSVSIADTLLSSVEMMSDGLEEDTSMRYQRSPIEFYPGAKAYVIAKGQPLDVIDSRDIEAFHLLRTRDPRKTWKVMQDYEVDSCGIGIRFRSPLFIDGDPELDQSIFAFPNRGKLGYRDLRGVSGVKDDSELLNVIIPNANFKVTPASVKASFAFEMAPFWIEYGKGPRYGSLAANGLSAHILHMGSDSLKHDYIGDSYPELLRLPAGIGEKFSELLYADKESVKDKSYAAWRSREGVSGTTQDGGFVRVGVIGTELSGTIDRVSIDITFGAGMTETVDVMKARVTRTFIAEKTMARLQRLGELYPGFEAIKSEIRNLRRIVNADRFQPQSTNQRTTSHRSIFDIGRVPIGGGMSAQTKVIPVTEAGMSISAGDVIWTDAKGKMSAKGDVFAGVATAAMPEGSEDANISIAYAGRVPMRLKGPFLAGGIVYATPGRDYATAEASLSARAIGTYAHSDSPEDDEEFTGLVHIGLGGKESFTNLALYGLRKKAEEWVVNVRRGYVCTIEPRGGEGVDMIKYVKVEPLWQDKAEDFTVKDGDKIGVVVKTDSLDVVQSAEIIVQSEYENHHAIPAPSSQDGVYFYWLANFTLNGSGASERLEIEDLYHSGGTIYHRMAINEIVNRGGEVDGEEFHVYDQWDKSAATHLVRSLWQAQGDGCPIMIKGNEALADYEILMTRIHERITQAQVKVSASKDGKLITIQGNGNDQTVTFSKNGKQIGSLPFIDGLYTGTSFNVEVCCESTGGLSEIE